MEMASPDTSSYPADPAIFAVIDLFVEIVVPKFTYITVIPSSRISTKDTLLARGLSTPTQHAKHALGFTPIEHMILHSIVTKPASIPATASGTLQFDVAFIMSTAQIFGLAYLIWWQD